MASKVSRLNPPARDSGRSSNVLHRVLLVDDHPMVRHGLRHVLESEKGFAVIGEAETADEAHSAIEHLNPDAVITELQLRGSDGIEFVRRVHTRHPRLPIMVFSMHDEAAYAERLIAVGAAGYIMKHAPIADLLSALRCVLLGNTYVSKPIGEQIIRRRFGTQQTRAEHPIRTLTLREMQILRLIGVGVSTRAIAQSLHLSTKTIESHRQHIKRKLGIATAAQLMQCAISCNIRWACVDERPNFLLDGETRTPDGEAGASSASAWH